MRATDEVLLKLARSDDAEAFRTLIDRHRPTLWRVAWRTTRNRGWAEDVLQQTLLQAWEHLEQFDGRSDIETWLISILLHCAAAQRRDEERQAFPRLVGEVESPEPSADDIVFAGEVRTRTAQAMRQMTSSERIAFSMRYLEGFPLDAISAVLHIRKDAVRQTLRRAVAKCRAALEPLRVKSCT